MREMLSSVKEISPGSRKETRAAFEGSQRQQTAQAAPSEAMVGVPGDPDQRKFLTEALANFLPVHNSITGSIAYSTNKNQYREYSPGHFQGLLAPPGEYSSKPFYYSDLSAEPFEGKTATREWKPSRPVITNQATAGPFSTRIIADKGTL